LNKADALFLTIAAIMAGILICTVLVQTPAGRALLNILDFAFFFLGFAHAIDGARRDDQTKMVFGVLLVIAVVGGSGLPEPIDSGAKLFLALCHPFIEFPSSS